MRIVITGLMLLASSLSVQAQGSMPDFNKMNPQDAARMNEAVRQSDPQTQKAFGEMQKSLKDAGHPAGTMLEMTKSPNP